MSSSSVPFYALDHWFRQRRSLPAQRSAYAWARGRSIWSSPFPSFNDGMCDIKSHLCETQHDYLGAITPNSRQHQRPPTPRIQLPYDVWSLFIHHLDFDSLRTVSCVSKEFNLEASRRLWKSFTIVVDRWALVTSTEACSYVHAATSVILARGRTAFVQDLGIEIGSSLGSEGEPECERALEAITALLREAKSVRSLRLSMHHHHQRIIQALLGIGDPYIGGIRSPTIPDPTFRLEVNDIHLLWGAGTTLGSVMSTGWVPEAIEVSGTGGSSPTSPGMTSTPQNPHPRDGSTHQHQQRTMQLTISITPQASSYSSPSYRDTSYFDLSAPTYSIFRRLEHLECGASDDDDFHALLFNTCKSVPTLRKATFHNICGQWRHKTRSYTRIHSNAEWIAT